MWRASYSVGMGMSSLQYLKQPPQSPRQNALPVKRIDGSLVMGHEYLAGALV